jgi:hypothetical protein
MLSNSEDDARKLIIDRLQSCDWAAIDDEDDDFEDFSGFNSPMPHAQIFTSKLESA